MAVTVNNAIRVLFIDSSKSICRSVKFYLEGFVRENMEIQSASTIQDLEKFSRDHWDVILVEDGMSRNGNAELLDRGEELFAGVLKIHLNRSADGLMTTCNETTSDDYFNKIMVNPAMVLRSVSNLIERRRLEDGMDERAADSAGASKYNEVTGLWNEAYLHERLEQEFNNCQRYGTSLTTCLIRIDEIESLEATYGDEVTNDLLRSIGASVRESIRNTDFGGHLSRDLICLAWTNTGISGSLIAVERLKRSLQASIFSEKASVSLSVECHYAVVQMDEEHKTIEDYMKDLEQTLARAVEKAAGHIEVADPLGL